MTPHQAYILAYIRDHRRQKGRPPTIRNITTKMGWRSTNTTWHSLDRLREEGYLLRATGTRGALRLTPKAKAFLEGVL